MGTSIAELFALGQVEGAGSVGLEGYDWEYFSLLHEDVEYCFEGEVTDVERVKTKSGGIFDRFVFSIDFRLILNWFRRMFGFSLDFQFLRFSCIFH